jgi:hypothetical protein
MLGGFMERLLGVSIALVAVVTLSAQVVRRGEASPIAPEIMLYDYPGVIVGVPIAIQQGQYLDTCNCPPFTGGSGSGIMAGVFYELPSEKHSLVRLGISAGIDYRRLVSSYRQQELVSFVSSDGAQRFDDVPVEFRQQATFSFFGLWAQPYVRFVPFASDIVAFGLGTDLGFLLNGTVQHTKSLTQNTVRLPNGETLSLQMPDGSSSTTIRDGDIIGLKRFQASLAFRIEASFRLSEQWYLRPGMQYRLPLTDVSASGMKVAAWMLTLALTRRGER